MDPENEPELLGLESTRNLVVARVAIRALAIVAWLALVGFALQQDFALLAAMGAVAVAPFWLIDAYLVWLRRGALGRPEPGDVQPHNRERRQLTGIRERLTRAWRRSEESVPRAGYQLLYPLLIALAIFAVFAIDMLGAGKEQHVQVAVALNPSEPPNLSVVVRKGLTKSERDELEQLRELLGRAQDPSDRRLGDLIDDLIQGAPNAAIAIALWTGATSGIAKKAIGIVLGALGRASGAGASFRTTVKVGRPQLSLGGLHVNLSLALRSPPMCKCKSRCSPCPGHGGGGSPVHPDGNGSGPPKPTTTTIPMSP